MVHAPRGFGISTVFVDPIASGSETSLQYDSPGFLTMRTRIRWYSRALMIPNPNTTRRDVLRMLAALGLAPVATFVAGCGSDGSVDVRWHVVAALRCLAEALEFQGHYEVQGAQH